jgi:hypothetical protein
MKKINIFFEGVETLLFCDESKFYIADGNNEDALFYFCVAINKNKVPKIDKQLKDIIQKHNVQATSFHSTKIFRENRPREELMKEIRDLIIDNKIHCFCFKYSKALLFKPTKQLNYLNDNDIFNFEDPEFQALFYFLLLLNTQIKDKYATIFKKDIIMFFDRNVYGKTAIEEFNFNQEIFQIKHMTFSEKSKISLLALPDFIGYIFRKSKISQNKAQAGDNGLEKSKLVIYSYDSLIQITNAKLFHLLDYDINILGKALEIEFNQ